MARLQAERRAWAKRCKALLEETAATAGLALAASSHTLSRVPHYHRSGAASQQHTHACKCNDAPSGTRNLDLWAHRSGWGHP